MSDCDTSREQDDVPPPNSVYKRRSSVFRPVQRKIEDNYTTIAIDDTKPETDDRTINIDVTDSKSTDRTHKPNDWDSEDFDLPAYIQNLRNERKSWKETLQARKAKRRKLQKQLALVEKHGIEFDLDLLSESERAFLQDRPDYRRICRNIKTLADVSIKVATLSKEITVLSERLVDKMERKAADATRKIIGMSMDI